jgi:hypothetical protein
MKRWQKILCWVVGAPAAVVAAFAVVKPDLTAFVFLALLGSLTNNMRPPEFAREAVAGGSWIHWQEPSEKFTLVLRKRFPLGSNEQLMRAALRSDGFEDRKPPPTNCVHPGDPVPIGVVVTPCPTHDWRRALDYYWGALPCGNQLTVLWDADRRGKITELDGYYGQTCL